MRIAVGGFQHETNTFAPQKATLRDFELPDAWPGLTRGPALFDAVRGINLPAAGFIDAARTAGHSLVPLTWCSATPSAQVERGAYEEIVRTLLQDLREQRGLDAVYLDLHGAMVAEHIDDADGELLRRVRAEVGANFPVVASLDFHANVSPLMVESASALIAYRSYPHIDMQASGERAMRALQDLRRGSPARALRQLPFLIPLTSQCTLIEPMIAVMAEVERLERPPTVTVNFTPGFPAADVVECGPAVFSYGFDLDALQASVERIASLVLQRERDFALDIQTVESALSEIARTRAAPGRPFVLADTQDNPGGGGTADTTSLLKALLARRSESVLAGVLCDHDAALRAHAAGIGATVELALGAGSRFGGETPIRGRFEVEGLGDGKFTATGPFYRGSRMELGPMALLRMEGVHIVVASRKQQAADQAMFRHVGAEPREFAVLALKSSVHFRADFGPIARRILIVDAPGANIADPRKLAFTKLRPGMRVARADV
jgi:microcystin degradation protein MlrC